MINPALLLIIGALPIALLQRPLRQLYLLALPIVAFALRSVSRTGHTGISKSLAIR